MKKNYAYNDRGQKCFCKYETAPTGVLYVSYFLKKYQFSLYWPSGNPLVRVSDVVDTRDGRKTIVTFRIHPILWMGSSFEDYTFKTVNSAINEVFTNHINIL
jgi:hypothetical protein